MKIITREWASLGPTGRKVKRTSYGYDLTVGGKRERRFDAEWLTEADAMAALTERLKQVEAGQVTRPAERTLSQLVEEYLGYKRDHGKRSLAEDKRMLNTRLLPALGKDLPAKRLTMAMIAQYERKRMAEVSAYTVSLELAVLRHMLRLARRWGYIERVPEIDMPRLPEGRQRYLNAAEIEALLKECRASRSKHLATIVTIAINTGMRRGEILGLAWEHVDLATARMTLYDTKNGRPRGVPMNTAVYDALIALEPDADQRAGLLFRHAGGRAWGKIRTAYENAVERAGLKDVRFHDLRHTAASHMVMRGATLKEVQEVLGHRTFAMTLRYAHLSPAHLRSAVDRLDGLTPPASGTDSAWVSSSEKRAATVPDDVEGGRAEQSRYEEADRDIRLRRA